MGPEKILETVCSFMKSKVLIVSQKLKVFDCIEDGVNNPDDIAKKLNIDANITKYLLNALYKLKFLKIKESCYYNTDISREFLVSSSENFIGDLLIFQENEWDRWSRLYELATLGKISFYDEKMNDDELITYIKAMDQIGRYSSRAIKPLISLNENSKIIDLGCGSGIFSIALKEKFHDAEIYMVDFKNVIEICKENIIARFGSLSGFKFFDGSYLELNFEEKFNCVFMSHNIQQYDETNIELILKNIKNMLSENGILVLHDYFIGEKTEFPDLFTFNMLLQDYKAHCLTFEEMKNILLEVGFSNIKFIDMGHGIPSSMIICSI